jgi:predicted aspartyl protease
VIRVRYSTALRPAAPIIDVVLGHPSTPRPAHAAEAQLDTGADRTVIPLAVVSVLRLRHLDDIEAVVAGGAIVSLPIFEVALRIDGVMDFILEVAAHADEPRVLLGRDVLNCLYATLSGPTRSLELSDQPLLPPTTP